MKNAVIAVMLSQKAQNPCAIGILAMTVKFKCCHLLPYESAEGVRAPRKRCPPVHLSRRGAVWNAWAERSRGRPGEKSIKPGAVFIGSWWKEALCVLQLQLQHAFLHHNLYVFYKPVIIDVLLF